MPGDLAAFVYPGQQGLVDVQNLQQLVRPAAVGHIQQLHAAGVADLGGIVAGEHIAHIVLGQENVAAAGVNVRLMLAHPHDLGQGEARQGRVGGDADEIVIADLFGDLVALLLGALVAPDDGGAQHLAVFIQHDQAVHLPGNAQGHHVRRVHAAFADHGFHRGRGGVPPVEGILLSPAVAGLAHGILHRGGADHAAFLVKKHGFGSGGTQVDTKYIFHDMLPLFCKPRPRLCAGL